MSTAQPSIATLARHFEDHGAKIYGTAASENASPLYAALCHHIATDPAVLQLVAEANQATTVTNLFFAAVHYLLLSGIQHPVAAYYPDLVETPLPFENAYLAFRAFCLEHAAEIRTLVNTRFVQTNEVRRCAALFPAFCLLAGRIQGRALALLEIGSSAGLHLLWDRYHYQYGPGERTGDLRSPVQIECELRGAGTLPVVKHLPVVTWRLGLDIHPIDVRDEDAVRWLRALIWPEHADRLRLLSTALSVARGDPPLLAGDAASVLPQVLATVPQNAVLCLFHSYTLNQMPGSVRERILAHIADYALQGGREVYRISQEGYSLDEPPRLELHNYEDGQMQSVLLAHCETHGRWLEWLI